MISGVFGLNFDLNNWRERVSRDRSLLEVCLSSLLSFKGTAEPVGYDLEVLVGMRMTRFRVR